MNSILYKTRLYKSLSSQKRKISTKIVLEKEILEKL